MPPLPKSTIDWGAMPPDLKLQAAKLDVYRAKVDAFSALADAHSHAVDALRYAMLAAGPNARNEFPVPPETPEGLSPEAHAAHLAIHDLLSVEEFEAEREKPGFVQINAFWAANGKRRFCCEKAAPMRQSGFVDAKFYYSGVKLNEAWMAEFEARPDPKKSWWTDALTWCRELFSAGR